MDVTMNIQLMPNPVIKSHWTLIHHRLTNSWSPLRQLLEPGTRRYIVLVSTRSPSVVFERKNATFFHEICVVVGWALQQASQSWTLTNKQSTVRLRGSRFWTAKTEERRKVLLECLWRVGGKVFYRYTTSQTLIGGSSSNTSLVMNRRRLKRLSNHDTTHFITRS